MHSASVWLPIGERPAGSGHPLCVNAPTWLRAANKLRTVLSRRRSTMTMYRRWVLPLVLVGGVAIGAALDSASTHRASPCQEAATHGGLAGLGRRGRQPGPTGDGPAAFLSRRRQMTSSRYGMSRGSGELTELVGWPRAVPRRLETPSWYRTSDSRRPISFLTTA